MHRGSRLTLDRLIDVEEDLIQLRELISGAARDVAPDYFMLPVADLQGGEPLIQYRERVYAYELYHQLRSRWPAWEYSLGGEVDKQGHPIVHGGDLEGVKPDLLIHVPGEMNHNLMVIEIKASRPGAAINGRAIVQDLRKLVAFRRIGYAASIFLVFGESIEGFRELARNELGLLDLELVDLYHHPHPGAAAQRVDW